MRVTLDSSPDKVGAKIRNAQLERIPYMLVIGEKEVEEGTVSVRHRDKEDLGTMPLEEFTAKITTRDQGAEFVISTPVGRDRRARPLPSKEGRYPIALPME